MLVRPNCQKAAMYEEMHASYKHLFWLAGGGSYRWNMLDVMCFQCISHNYEGTVGDMCGISVHVLAVYVLLCVGL